MNAFCPGLGQVIVPRAPYFGVRVVGQLILVVLSARTVALASHLLTSARELSVRPKLFPHPAIAGRVGEGRLG